MSKRPLFTAECNGARPLLLGESTSAPWSSKSRTTSKCPLSDAIFSGVQPSQFRVFTSAPAWISNLDISDGPIAEASAKEVVWLVPVRISISVLCSSNNRTMSARPPSDALCSGFSPSAIQGIWISARPKKRARHVDFANVECCDPCSLVIPSPDIDIPRVGCN